MRSIRALPLLWMLGLVAVGTAPQAPAQSAETFVERFEAGPGDTWTIESSMDRPQLWWVAADDVEPGAEARRPGLHYRSVATEPYIKSHDDAWARWEVGVRPFEFSWDVDMERALAQRWFYPGVAVALTSAPPGQIGEHDIALTIGIHMEGMAAAVRRGGLYDTPTEGRGAYTRISDKKLSDLISGKGGGISSVTWPMKDPSGSRLKFRIERAEDHTITFTIDWPDLPGDRGKPYWTGRWKMPEEVAQVPLKYVVVKRMPVLRTHVSYAGFVMQGAVQNIQGRVKSAAPAPIVEGLTADEAALAGGATITLKGRHFREGDTVSVGGKPARHVQVVSAKKITAELPDLPADRRHALSVTGPNGLFGELKRGVPYGRMLETLRPRSALPEGGDTIDAHGAGFEQDTRFTIGGKPAEVVEVIDSTHVKLTVPQGEAGRARVAARLGDKRYAGEPRFGYAPHPYLYFNQDDLPALRQKFENPFFADYARRVLDEADRHMQRKIDPGDFNASVGVTSGLAMTYAFTGEAKYRDRLMAWVRQGWLATEYNDFNMMSIAGMAIAYDILYRGLPPEDRAAFQDYLDRMLDGYLKLAGGAWFLGHGPNFSNSVPVGNAGGMLAGLAMMHATPKAQRAIDTAARLSKRYPDQCISPDGGCREGVQYWDFGLSFHLILAHALNHATGDDRGLLDHPHLKANVNFIRTQLGGHGGMYNFNDSKMPWLGGYAICADLGSRYEQPLMLWVADLCAKGGEKTRAREIWAPFAFLWRSEQPAPEQFPGVPTLSWLKDMQWGGMRSDESFIPKMAVGVKGGRGPLTHHKQPDLGSFVFHANGEAYLVDPGYYEPEPSDHNMPVIDGEGPGDSGADITEGWEQDAWRYMVVDSTDGWGNKAQRVRRLIVMHGEDRVVVLDDLIPAQGKPGNVAMHYQTAWPPAIDEQEPGAIHLEGQKGKAVVRTFGHLLKLTAADRAFKSGWHWAKIGKDGPGDWHTVRGDYTADVDRPLVTVIQPTGLDDQTPAAPQVSYGQGAITIDFADGPDVRFEQTRAGWQFIKPLGEN